MKSSLTLTLVAIALLFIGIGCSEYVKYEPESFYTEEERATITEHLNLPETPENYQVFGAGISEFNNNMIATLGRVLFYDKDLSADGTISCASCHHQELAFSDNVSFSEGVHENLTTRNSIALGSIASFNDEYGGHTGSEQTEGNPGLFWDERAPSVKAQMEQTFANPDEMGMDITQLVGIVKSKSYYQTLFNITQFGFGVQEAQGITTDNILTSIETFVRSVRSNQSKFDLVAENNNVFNLDQFQNDWSGFTKAENNGKVLFANHCGSCHGKSVMGQSFINNTIAPTVANNGLDMEYLDKGVGEVSFLSSDNGKFKIPGLRNIALTAPYMHDGRFEGLKEVVDFYSEGIQAHENLDRRLQGDDRNPIKLNLSEEDKLNLVSFLNTLTDEKMINDSKWSRFISFSVLILTYRRAVMVFTLQC